MACAGALPRRRSSALLAASTVGVERLSVLFSAEFLFPGEELGRGVMILPAAGVDVDRRFLTRQEDKNYRLRGNTNEQGNSKNYAAGSAALLQVEAAEGRNLLPLVFRKRSGAGFLEQQSTRMKDSDTASTSGRGRGGGRNGGNGSGGNWREIKDANGGAGKNSGSKGEGGSKGGGRDNGAAGEGAGQGGPIGQQGQEAQHQQGTAQSHSATVVSHADATEATAAGGVEKTQEAQAEEVLIKQTSGEVGHHGGHQTGAGQAGHGGEIVAHQERQIVGDPKKTSSSPPAEPAPPLDDPEDIECARKAGSEQECEGADPAAQRCFFRPAFSDPTGRTDENGAPYVYPAECVGGKNGCDAVSDQLSCDQLPVCAWVDSTDEVLLGARVAGFAFLQPHMLGELTPQTSPFQALDTSGGLLKERLPDDRESRPHAEQWCTAVKHLGTCAMFSANAEQCVRHGCPGVPMYRLDAPASSCTGTLGDNLVAGAPPSLGPCCFRFAFGTGVEQGGSAPALKIVSCSAGEDPEAPDGEFGPVHEADICPRDVAEAQEWVVSGAEGGESSSNAAATTSGGQTSGTSGTNGPASSLSTGMSNSNGGILFSSGQQVTNECEGKTSSREDCEAVVDSTGGALCWFQAEVTSSPDGGPAQPAACNAWSDPALAKKGCRQQGFATADSCDASPHCVWVDTADAEKLNVQLGHELLAAQELGQEGVALKEALDAQANGLLTESAYCVAKAMLRTCDLFAYNSAQCVQHGCAEYPIQALDAPTAAFATCKGELGAFYKIPFGRVVTLDTPCADRLPTVESCELAEEGEQSKCWLAPAGGDANSPWAVCHEWSEDTERAGCAAKTGVCDALSSCTMQDFSAAAVFDKEILTDLGKALLTELESVCLNQLEADGLAVAKACVPASKLETCESFSGNAMACVRKGCEKFPTKEDPTCTGTWGANLVASGAPGDDRGTTTNTTNATTDGSLCC
ncbi:unnamed protein product [Amoebophrya sp. A120]|nr:unnamed protein product [Amoebophrya sp. A120]|eukprot:GSA120T00016507001.1